MEYEILSDLDKTVLMSVTLGREEYIELPQTIGAAHIQTLPSGRCHLAFEMETETALKLIKQIQTNEKDTF